MVRFKLAFGDLDINNIEANNTLEELQELNLKYSITRGLAAAPFRAVKQYVPVENSATLFDIEVDNPDNTMLNFTLKTQPKNGTITGNTPDNLTYTKGSGFSYKDSVTYEITGNGYSRNVTVVFTDEF